MRRPASAAIRECAASTAGIDDAPGSDIPIASAIAVIVLAVPIVMHVPWLRAIPERIAFHSASSMLPARRSSQYLNASDPEPSVLPAQLPRSIGPAGRKIAGRSALVEIGRAHV